MDTFVTNLSGKVERIVRDGRTYLVAPATLLVSGVLNGSEGPIFYPPSHIEQDPTIWNGMPIVVKHPVHNGIAISARDPAILDKQGIGYVYGASAIGGKAKAQLWFDEERTAKVDNRILTMLNAGTPIELSTGLFAVTTDAPANSVHNGTPYKKVAFGYKADHIAVLPDEVGAFSILYGCGVFVNSSDKRTLWQKLGELLGITTNVVAIEIPGESVEAGPILTYSPIVQPGDSWASVLVDNIQGYQLQKVGLESAPLIEETLITNPYPNEHSARVEDPSKFKKDTFRRKEIAPGISVIMAKKDAGGPMMVQAYRFTASKFTAEEAKAWLRKHKINCTFEAASSSTGGSAGASGQKNNSEGDVNKAQLVSWLIANCDCWKHQGDQTILEAMSEDKLKALKEGVERTQRAEAVANAARQGFTSGNTKIVYNAATGQWDSSPVAPTPAPAPVVAPPPPPIDNATRLTAEEQEDLAFARQERTRQKEVLVARLVANVSDEAQRTAHATWLRTQPMANLQHMASLLPPPPAQPALPPLYEGATPPPLNNAADDPNDVLPTPSIDWAAEATALGLRR